MYCKNCGEKLNDNDRVCPACGTPVESAGTNSGPSQSAAQGAPHTGAQTYNYSNGSGSTSRSTYQYSGPEYQASDDSGSAGWGFLGCCFPLIGLILFLVWKDDKPRSAKSAGIGAIIGVAITIILTVILFALGMGFGLLGVIEGVSNGEIDLSELEDYIEQNTSTIINTLKL